MARREKLMKALKAVGLTNIIVRKNDRTEPEWVIHYPAQDLIIRGVIDNRGARLRPNGRDLEVDHSDFDSDSEWAQAVLELFQDWVHELREVAPHEPLTRGAYID